MEEGFVQPTSFSAVFLEKEEALAYNAPLLRMRHPAISDGISDREAEAGCEA